MCIASYTFVPARLTKTSVIGLGTTLRWNIITEPIFSHFETFCELLLSDYLYFGRVFRAGDGTIKI
jgi:hypothetical protein